MNWENYNKNLYRDTLNILKQWEDYDPYNIWVDNGVFSRTETYECVDIELVRALVTIIHEKDKQIERAKSLNKNLKRISRERANADRGIKPKKQSSGFKIMSFCSRYEKVCKPNGKIENVLVYKTVYQTPYDKCFLYSDVVNMVWDYLPFTYDFRAKDGYNAINDILDDEVVDKQYIYRWTLRINNLFSEKKSYWEIELNHTKTDEFRIYVGE